MLFSLVFVTAVIAFIYTVPAHQTASLTKQLLPRCSLVQNTAEVTATECLTELLLCVCAF